MKLVHSPRLQMMTASITTNTDFVSRRNRIGIDYGPRFIGIAMADFFGNVKTHSMLPHPGNLSALALNILAIARSYAAAELVLGIPLDPNSKLNYDVENFNGQLCLNFSRVLSSVVHHETQQRMKVQLFDETFTTKEAQLRLSSSKVKASIDAMSAACLLERFLEDRGKGSIEAIPCTYPPPKELAVFNYEMVRKHIARLYGKDKSHREEYINPWDVGESLDITPTVTFGLKDEDYAELSPDEIEMLEERAKRRPRGTLKRKPPL